MIEQVKAVGSRVLIARSHVDAFCWTGIRTQIAVAAFGHIDVKLRHMQTYLVPCAGFLDVIGKRLDRLDGDTIHRTGSLTL